jgi:hypothetical protein
MKNPIGLLPAIARKKPLFWNKKGAFRLETRRISEYKSGLRGGSAKGGIIPQAL